MRVLVVDDHRQAAEETAEYLANAVPVVDGTPVAYESVTSFQDAKQGLGEGRFDAAVLDVVDDSTNEVEAFGTNEVGKALYEQLIVNRFVPVVFYSGYADSVRDLEQPPFVSVVEKSGDISLLSTAVSEALGSGLAQLSREISEHVARGTATFIAQFVREQWLWLKDHPADLAHLLTRRLSLSLDAGVGALAERLGIEPGDSAHVAPSRFYIMPPIDDEFVTGDIFSKDGKWFLLLTPACDLAQAKAETVLLADCTLLKKLPGYEAFAEGLEEVDGDYAKLSNTKKKAFEDLLKGRGKGLAEARYYYLPAAWSLPDLMVDLARVTNTKVDVLDRMDRVASLDSPFAHAIVSQFQRFIGRVGTPDLDYRAQVERLAQP